MSGTNCKPVTIALVLSLCLNVFLIGAGIVMCKKFEARHPQFAAMMQNRNKPPLDKFQARMDALADKLTPEAGTALRQAMQEGRAEAQEKMKNVEAARQASKEAALADPFDEARLREAFAAQYAAMDEIHSIMKEKMIKAMSAMTPEQRKQFIEAKDQAFGGFRGPPRRPMPSHQSQDSQAQ